MSDREACLIRPETQKHKVLDGGAHAWRMTSQEDHGWNVDAWLTVFRPGETHEWHDHEEDELIYIIEGEGRYELEDKSIEFRGGDCIFLPRKTMHRSMTGGREGRKAAGHIPPGERVARRSSPVPVVLSLYDVEEATGSLKRGGR